MTDATALEDLIKAYDVRGVVPEPFSTEVARAIGAAFAEVVVAPSGGRTAVIGRDMRSAGPALPLDVVDLYFELDGSFPNHEANPLDPKNLVDLQAAVVANGADIGLTGAPRSSITKHLSA